MVGRESSKRCPKKVIVGWNKHVAEAHRDAQQKFKVWVWYGKPTTGPYYNDMYETRKIFKSRLKWCQDHESQIKMDIIASHHSKKNFCAFWKHTNKLQTRPGIPVSVGGVSEPEKIANLFKECFTVKSPLGPSRTLINAEPGMALGVNFKSVEVAKSISSMSRGKSPGHDGLSIEHLRFAGPHLPRVLAMLYSFCMGHSYLPSEMLRTVVVPIVKNKTGDLADSGNYRPISLATVISKVLDSMLNTKLNKFVTLHANQFGFRPGLSTESAVLCVKHTVAYYSKRETPVYACFLDLSKAFDLVSYDVLWAKLEKLKLPTEIQNILKFWYGNQVNNVRWAGTLSRSYGLECGVRQGGLTSPTLFNLYMNELIEGLSSTRVGCFIDGVSVNNISYADDMVLLSASVCGLRKLIAQCEVYARTHGLMYNCSKSEIMVFESGGRSPDTMPVILLNEKPLKRTYKFKYLGHILTPDLKDDADVERERRALSIRANMLVRRFARCSLPVKVTLFRAYCTTFYTCSLWARCTRKSYSALRVQYNNAFRMLVGLPRFCSASGMFADAHIDCFYATMRKRCASLVSRVRASSNSVLNMIADRLDCNYINRCCAISHGMAQQ
uniref:Reverse transcriptase domain-containing protein n=1 Tax=Heliothis virescens TaxID=7102 RepID=A0A2A4KA90_HELVI